MFFELLFFPELNINYIIVVDHVSLVFILLTAFIIPVALLSQGFFYNAEIRQKAFVVCLFLIEFLLLNSFLVLDILFFFIFFEIIIIPVYFLIGI